MRLVARSLCVCVLFSSSSFILHKLSISVFCIRICICICIFAAVAVAAADALAACLASRFVSAVVVAFVWTFGSTHTHTHAHAQRDSYTLVCSWQKSATATTSHGGCNLFYFTSPLFYCCCCCLPEFLFWLFAHFIYSHSTLKFAFECTRAKGLIDKHRYQSKREKTTV